MEMGEPRPSPRSWQLSERGSATAEVAILLPGVVLMLALVLAAGSGVVTQIRCVDAARAAARLAARGEPDGVVLAAARAAAPAGAQVSAGTGGGLVSVQVTADVAMPVPGAPALTVSGRATARAEQPKLPER